MSAIDDHAGHENGGHTHAFDAFARPRIPAGSSTINRFLRVVNPREPEQYTKR